MVWSVTVNTVFSRLSYKWNHTVCFLLFAVCFPEFNVLFYFCLRWVFVAAHGFSLVAASGVVVRRLLITVVSLFVAHGP